MQKVICFHDTQNIMLAFSKKFSEHVHNPCLGMIVCAESDPVIPVEDFLVIISEIKEAHPKNYIFCVSAQFIESENMHKHFNLFNVWSDHNVVNLNDAGVWISNPSEVDYLFNQVLPWIFD